MHTVLLTSVFQRHAERAKLTEDDVISICSFLAANPRAGVVISGAGGARKVRFAGRGRGKSGGYRTIHFYAAEDVPVFLLALVDKGKRADLSQRERNELATVLPKVAEAYRKSVRATLMKSKGLEPDWR
jgi:hypothetical protein